MAPPVAIVAVVSGAKDVVQKPPGDPIRPVLVVRAAALVDAARDGARVPEDGVDASVLGLTLEVVPEKGRLDAGVELVLFN